VPSPGLTPKSFGDKLSWVGLGGVDVVFRWPDTKPAFVELKCGAKSDTLGPCAWDALKLASGISNGNAGTGYLLAALPTALWDASTLGRELFTTRGWSTLELRNSFSSWWPFWEKDGHIPGRVAESLATIEIETFPLAVGGTAWQLRLSRVEPRGSRRLQWESTLPV
jgi:hypothetical protein